MIRPLFPFYGSKWRDARRYPAPRDGTVIEPFAGSAGYALWHEPRRVVLCDLDPVVVAVWQYLIAVSPAEILALPDLEPGESVDDLGVSQEARWLIGFWLNRGSAVPKKTQTAYSQRTDRQQLVWSPRARARVAEDLCRVRHWQVSHGSYESVEVADATYFIDPPYVDKGRFYRCHAMDYKRLAAWARSLPGQVIVCEQAGADWLPFRPLASIKSSKGRSEEVVFTRGADEQLGFAV